jgi:hypothetical protein
VHVLRHPVEVGRAVLVNPFRNAVVSSWLVSS